MPDAPLNPIMDCLHCRVGLSVPLSSHLVDCPLRATAAEEAERLFETRRPGRIDGQAGFPVNGIHFLGWDQHVRRGRPPEAEDTTANPENW